MMESIDICDNWQKMMKQTITASIIVYLLLNVPHKIFFSVETFFVYPNTKYAIIMLY
jgi:hypothetical protein